VNVPLDLDEGRYASVLASQKRSPVLREIYKRAYGADYPAEADPFGFVTVTDLHRIAELLRLDRDHQLADLGCGRGGPGLWIARQTGAMLTGIDLVPAAIAEADLARATFGLQSRAAFHVASFTDTGLPRHSFDAAMSVDALWMVLDKPAAVQETLRILKPSGRFVLTTWEPSYLDHTALLADAGFEVLVREETPDWYARQVAVYQGIISRHAELVAELGDSAAAVLIDEAYAVPASLADTPRVLLAAAAPGPRS
jgi:ubiquinone/menaquinone biosynthesis C-methylase UbiE